MLRSLALVVSSSGRPRAASGWRRTRLPGIHAATAAFPAAAIAAIAGLSVALLVTAAAREASAAAPGLYKDGQRILGLEELFGSSRSSATSKSARGMQLYRDLSAESAAPGRRALSEYAGHLRGILDVARRGDVEPERAGADLVALAPRLDETAAAALVQVATDRARLAASGISQSRLERLDQLARRIADDARALNARVAAVREARGRADVAAIRAGLAEVERLFERMGFMQDPPFMNSKPSPMTMERAAPAVVHDDAAGRAPTIERSRPGASTTSPTPADLAPTIDVQITPEIQALADSLEGSAAALYALVREQVTFEAYLGSRKGSQQTLDHRRGNDYDHASLLIALLRASGIPARYASGTSKMPLAEAANWLGIDDPVNAASLLATAGMQGTLFYVGGTPVAISCNRVWVEAWLPFINYRGAANGDSAGYAWIPLDPAFKQYAYTQGANGPELLGFDGEAFVDDYIASFQVTPPIEVFKADMVGGTGLTEQELVTSRVVIADTDGILPATLPWELLSSAGSFSEIAANQRYTVRFHVYGSGTDLDHTTSIPEIAGKQVTISYVGATPADQDIIDAAGGIFHVSNPSLVDLKPVLKVDGCQVAIGTGQVMMGVTHFSDMHFTAPTGASNQMPVVANVITAGNYQGIGIDTEDALPASSALPQTTCAEDQLGQTLHQTALTYLNNVDVAGDEAARLMHMVVLNDVAEAIVENQVTVYFSGGFPISFDWAGMIVDADRKILGPFTVDGADRTCDYMRLGGADGSVQENRLFETLFGEEAISAIKILALAADSGIAVCRITSSIAADCPTLSQPPAVVSAINAALAAGHHVIIPRTQLAYHQWSGTGWIDIDPVTCAAGYIISGGQAGGATVQTWDITYPDLFCIEPIGPIAVAPAATGDLYCAESGAKWTFTVPTIKFHGKNSEGACTLLGTESNKAFDVKYTIKEIADKWGAGEYTFTIGSSTTECGCTTIDKKITIVKIEFPKDDFLVYKGKTKEMKDVKITPASAAGSVTFESADPSKATVSGSPPTLTVNGIAEAETKVKAKLNGTDCAQKDVIVFSVTLKSPHDNPNGSPNATNERVFNAAAPGVLTVDCEAEPNPNVAKVKTFLEDNKVRWTIDAIGASALTWAAAWPGDAKKGEGLKVTATFTGLPANNTDFGKKVVKLEVLTDGSTVDFTKPNDIEVFYTGTATNHPGGVATHPNWFHYYKQNAGGGAYTYRAAGRSQSSSAGGIGSVQIGNEAYSGDTYITTGLVGGLLSATGWSATNYYYANFLGVLAHESQHATNEVPVGGATDPDGDYLSTAFETGTSHTNPAAKYSARGVLVGAAWDDGEVYAGGPVEGGGIAGANTSQDWARPGTNYGR